MTSPDASNDRTRASSRPRKDRQARKYGFACANCRKRKVRCDGGLPSCDRCVANRELCYFNKGPSLAYSLELKSRLDVSESLVDRLRGAQDAERLRILDEHFSNETSGKRKPEGPLLDSPRSDESSELIDLFEETSIDEDGNLCFYGTTSLFHLQPDQSTISRTQESPGTLDAISGLLEETTPSGQLPHTGDLPFITNAKPDIKSYLNIDISSDICNELLETYWCWPHNIHLVLSRKVFMRDLINSGPYVTPFLLNVVLAQASRYSDRPDAATLGASFSQRTLNAMGPEVSKGSSIPTIQALLIFSGLECTHGRSSQGWLYSGMAFRMMRDMGIHIPSRKLGLVGRYSPVELALRQQIYWSCYTWDKTMSWCLGRAPVIPATVPLPTMENMLDGEEADEELWTPRFTTVSALEVGVSQKADTSSRFVVYCQLCAIIDSIQETLYYPKPNSTQHHHRDFLDSSIEKLDGWAHNLPSHLYIGENCRSITCPPLHILVLNLLYRATIILLCRPYRSREPRAREMATSAADMIDRLFMLHIRRFGFRIITYLEAYTMFVASTINILDLKEGIDPSGASARLSLSLEVLRNATSMPSTTGCVTGTPSNARCVEIIEELLRKSEKARAENQSNPPQQSRTGPFVSSQGTGRGHQRRSSLTPTAAIPHQRSSLRTTQEQPSSTGSLASTTSPTARVIDFQFFNNPDISTTGNWPSIFNNETTPPGFIPMPMQDNSPATKGGKSVETPLRWVADNVDSDHSWMRMDVDFDGYMGNPAEAFARDPER